MPCHVSDEETFAYATGRSPHSPEELERFKNHGNIAAELLCALLERNKQKVFMPMDAWSPELLRWWQEHKEFDKRPFK